MKNDVFDHNFAHKLSNHRDDIEVEVYDRTFVHPFAEKSTR